MQKIDPKDYNLPSRLKIELNNKRELFFIINRKSRIIMKDGIKILKYVEEIRKKDFNIKINLKTNAPVCSKTKTFLVERGVKVVS